MKATVYYVELSRSQVDVLNVGGWQSEIGRAYTAARAGKFDGSNRTLLRRAATLEAENAEHVWTRLQNVADSWRGDPTIECHTEFSRSMDVGDIIVWSDGRMERCASSGFEPVANLNLEV